MPPTNRQEAEKFKLNGNAHYEAGEYDDAISCYTRGLEFLPDAKLYGNRSQCYVKLENYKDAILDSTEAIRLDGNFMKAYSRRGYSLFCLGLWKEVMSDLEVVVSNTIEKPPQETVLYLAEVKDLIDEWAESTDSKSLNYLVELRIAKHFLDAKDYKMTISHCNRGISYQKDPELFVVKSDAYVEMFMQSNMNIHLEMAIQEISICIGMSVGLNCDDLFLKRSEMYKQSGMFDKSLDDLKQIRKKSENVLKLIESAEKSIHSDQYDAIVMPTRKHMEKFMDSDEMKELMKDSEFQDIVKDVCRDPHGISKYAVDGKFQKFISLLNKAQI